MDRRDVVLTTAAVGAVGYALAGWLALAAGYAERVEDDRYCRDPSPTPPDLATASRHSSS